MSSSIIHPPITLPDGCLLGAEASGTRLTLLLDGRALLALESDGHSWRSLSEAPIFALWAFAYWSFARDEHCQRLRLHAAECPLQAFVDGLLSRDADGLAQIERSAFWQLPRPWLQQADSAGFPEVFRIDAGKRHPLRPPKPEGEVYRRFDVRLGSWISLRALDIDHDLERFNRWQNNPRVEAFWQEGGTLAQHREYLGKLEADPHTLTLIGCFDDQPFAYFEAYWAKEDRIAPFYPADDYDRGIHMLVGEESHRGPHKVASWLSALVHYLFLDDPRTQRVVAEPRADNGKMIGYMHDQCFHCDKEFDFPHKRAALMILGRERFFDRCKLA